MKLAFIGAGSVVFTKNLEGRRDHVHHAAMLDRHAPSVLSLDEIAAMVNELIEAHGEALPAGVREPSGLWY